VIEVIEPGAFTTVQDLGRAGLAALGVPRSGAFDRGALRLANRLVGNPAGAACLEVTFGGLVVRLRDAATVAVTGAQCPGVGWGAAITLAAGSVLRLDPPTRGLRTYLAVRGGIDVPAELGSRSTDLLSGLGPARLVAGDLLPTGAEPGTEVVGAAAAPTASGRTLRVVFGPRDDRFMPAARTALTTAHWTVRQDCDRIGVRLDGPRLERVGTAELPSEPTLPGALQVPPDGRPILLGPDAPVTGGYPVIAVVLDGDPDLAGQLRPGDVITFSRAG
jgi:biotin-dependent carboxylase-like uncharacterized protein